MKRRRSKLIYIGNVPVGGGMPISVQSMTKTDTRDYNGTLRQIRRLKEVGCDIVRISVPDRESVQVFKRLVDAVDIPLIADVHFDWRLAIGCIEAGAKGIRINPGNIGGKDKLKKIVKITKQYEIPIRVGSNTGSIASKWLRKFGGPTIEALVENALEYVRMIEDLGYDKIKVSVKATDVWTTINAYRKIARRIKYPLHLGVTEAGPLVPSAVRSSLALGVLLMEGIGDTVRVSVTGDPVYEVIIAREILQSLGIRKFAPTLISCPTCSRCNVNLVKIVDKLYKYLLKYPVESGVSKVAVMGCVVNGPGEAKECDIGIACGRASGVLFKKGKPIRRVEEDAILEVLISELKLHPTSKE